MATVAFYTEVMDDRARDLQAMLDILQDVGANSALIGGLAVGYHGRPRATVDVDLLVPGRFLKRIAAAARGHDYVVRAFQGMIRIYPPGSGPKAESIADFVSADANPVLRAAFRQVEAAELLGEPVQIVNRAALVALKFHAAVSPDRAIEDKYQDIADIGRIIGKRFDAQDEETARRIAALSYPGADDDFAALIDHLRHGRPVKDLMRVVGKAGRRYDLKTLRTVLNRTQSDVARAAGMAQGDVSLLEARKDVKLSTLARYAAALGGAAEVAVVIDGRRYLLDL